MRPEMNEHAFPDPPVSETGHLCRRPRPDAAEVVVAHRRRVGLVAVSLGGVLLLVAMAFGLHKILIKLLADAWAWFGTAYRP